MNFTRGYFIDNFREDKIFKFLGFKIYHYSNEVILSWKDSLDACLREMGERK